jgi:hypothetical protein
VDSCGAFGTLKETCTNGCAAGACITCTPNASSQCYGGNVYYYDSCGNLGSLKQTCSDGCSAGACIVCTSHASTKCSGGNLYYYDSCGKIEEMAEDCPGSCINNQCSASTWRCVGTGPTDCTCVISADAVSYPLLACPSYSCCFTYASTAGPACYCGNHDAAICAQYVSIYNASPKSSCP